MGCVNGCLRETVLRSRYGRLGGVGLYVPGLGWQKARVRSAGTSTVKLEVSASGPARELRRGFSAVLLGTRCTEALPKVGAPVDWLRTAAQNRYVDGMEVQ